MKVSRLNVEILVALPDRESGGAWQEFVSQDLGQEDIVGHVPGLEAVAADGGVGAAQVARFPGKVALAEGDLDLVVQSVLGADMGAVGIWVGTDLERRRSKAARTRFGAVRTGMG